MTAMKVLEWNINLCEVM